MKTLLNYLKPYYFRMFAGFLIKTTGTVAELMLPFILSHILSNVIEKSVKEIIYWGLLMVVFAAIAWILNVIANRMAAFVSRNFTEGIRKDLFKKTLNLSASQTDKFTIPSLESRITTDTYNVHHFVNMMQRMGIRAPILLIGGVAITLIMDASLSLVMIILLPIIFAVVYFIRLKGIPLYKKVQQSVDGMIRVVREDSQGIRVIKALSKTDYEHKRYDIVNKKLINDETKAGITMGLVNPVMTFFMNLGSVAVIVIAASRIADNLSNPETVIAFIQYFTQISMAMMTVTRMFVMYTKCSASASRIEEVLLTEEEIFVCSEKDYPDKDTLSHILFDNVTFSYNKKRDNLKNINFEIPKGGSLGIIGATGSGKSTIIKLLLRFYDIEKGGIYINGKNIKTIEKSEFYKMFGSVLQNDFLYSDTIMENIKFGRDISDENVKKAAKIAQADDFITAFKNGYNHILSQHGTNISGGQKQRVLIARALAGNPEILILDDSSSALDYKTDSLLRTALKENMKETTLITVAQRVSSVKDCGIIIVLEDGKINGIGTHTELLKNCTIYKEISDSQAGGAFVD